MDTVTSSLSFGQHNRRTAETVLEASTTALTALLWGLYYIHQAKTPRLLLIMITQEDRDFVNFLFGKLLTETDTDMIDLHDDDSCCDHLEFEQLALDV